MKVKVFASLRGYAHVATQTTVIEIEDEDIEDMNEQEIEEYIWECSKEWADEQLEVWHEVVENGS